MCFPDKLQQWLRLRRQHVELQTEKERFEKLSTIDGLTKVLNRHGIEQFIASRQNANLPTSVIVIDLDHFKKINDHRGHYGGDRVLQNVGEILPSQTRNTDGLGRWGGEEEIAKAVMFLIHSDFVTGETIRVDGGRHIK